MIQRRKYLKRSTKPLKRPPLARSTKPIKSRKVSKRFAKRRDPRFLKWVKTLPCSIPGCRSGLVVDPHHVRGRKVEDFGSVIPLCRGHHDEHDHLGRRSFPAKYGVDLLAIAFAVAEQYLPVAEAELVADLLATRYATRPEER